MLLCPSGMGDEERLPIVDGVRRNDLKALVHSVFYSPRRVDPALLTYYKKQFANRCWRTGLLRTIRGTMEHVVRERLPQLDPATLLIPAPARTASSTRATPRQAAATAAQRQILPDRPVRPRAAN